MKCSESFLSLYLSPLSDELSQADVTDIYINQPEEVWVEKLDGTQKRVVVPELSEALLWRLARQVAAHSNQGISRGNPLLAAWLEDGSRIQVIAPPATRSSIAIAIRKHVAADLGLEDYVADGAFAETVGRELGRTEEAQMSEAYEAGDWAGFLRMAVELRKTIVISGGTSSGKTTFLNALVRTISADERLVFIEDTPEIRITHPNAVGLIATRGDSGEARVTSEELLTASLRLRPDRIILGELRGDEAITFLRAANTGHPGSLTTIHANSPDQAVEQLALLAGRSNYMSRNDIISYIDRNVDVFVQLVREKGRRKVSAIKFKHEALFVEGV